MYNLPQLAVDSIQNGKKQFIEKHISDPELKHAWTNYVDAQTNFLHVGMETAAAVATTLGRQLMETKVERLLNPFQIDWFRAGWDAWTAHCNKRSTV